MRILIISLHFPPIAGVSARAMAELSRAMDGAGHQVHVLTVQPLAGHPVYRLGEDDTGIMPRRVRVHRIPMGPLNRLFARLMEPSARSATLAPAADFRGYLNRYTKWIYQARSLWQPIAIPDASADWLPHATWVARRLLKRHEFELVVSMGNPHTCHLVAFLATRGRPSQWVPFYGDAWGLDPGLSTRPAWTGVVNRLIERRLLKAAARIMVCTEAMRTGLVEAYGIDPAKINSTYLAVPDLDSYEAVVPRPAQGFHLVYTGSIYEALQDPLPFFRAARRLSGDLMTISFFGSVPERYLHAARQLGFQARFAGWRPLPEVIDEQRSATALLIFGHRGGQVMPSKVFEYFAARRPILCIRGDREDLIAPLIKTYRRGLVVNNCADEIGAALDHLVKLYSNSQLDGCFDLHPLRQFGARATAARLMNGIIGGEIEQCSMISVGKADARRPLHEHARQ
jgi:glycosyltransferase involved in cell wall biosynthesis